MKKMMIKIQAFFKETFIPFVKGNLLKLIVAGVGIISAIVLWIVLGVNDVSFDYVNPKTASDLYNLSGETYVVIPYTPDIDGTVFLLNEAKTLKSKYNVNYYLLDYYLYKNDLINNMGMTNVPCYYVFHRTDKSDKSAEFIYTSYGEIPAKYWNEQINLAITYGLPVTDDAKGSKTVGNYSFNLTSYKNLKDETKIVYTQITDENALVEEGKEYYEFTNNIYQLKELEIGSSALNYYLKEEQTIDNDENDIVFTFTTSSLTIVELNELGISADWFEVYHYNSTEKYEILDLSYENNSSGGATIYLTIDGTSADDINHWLLYFYADSEKQVFQYWKYNFWKVSVEKK